MTKVRETNIAGKIAGFIYPDRHNIDGTTNRYDFDGTTKAVKLEVAKNRETVLKVIIAVSGTSLGIGIGGLAGIALFALIVGSLPFTWPVTIGLGIGLLTLAYVSGLTLYDGIDALFKTQKYIEIALGTLLDSFRITP